MKRPAKLSARLMVPWFEFTIPHSEAVVRRCSVKEVFKIHKKTPVLSFCNKTAGTLLKAESSTGVFL